MAVQKKSIWSLVAFFVSFILILPIAYILFALFLPEEGAWAHIVENLLFLYVGETFFVSIGTLLMSLIWALPTAWLVNTKIFPFSRYLRWLLLLPLAIPAYFLGYTYSTAFSIGGSLQGVLQFFMGEYVHVPIMSIYGAIFVMSLALYPYIFSLSGIAFAKQGQNLLDSGRMLGKSEWQIFWKVALPMARPAIVAGMFLILMEVLNEYGTFKHYGVNTFTTGIFKAWFGLGDKISAVRLSAILLLVVVFLMIFENKMRGKMRFSPQKTNSKNFPYREKLNVWQGFLAFIFCFFPCFLGFLFPFLQMCVWAQKTYSLVLEEAFFTLIFRTLSLGLGTAFLIALVATFFNFTKRLFPHPLLDMSISATQLGYATPGAIIAVGITFSLLFFENHIFRFLPFEKTGFFIAGTVKALVLAYMIRFMAVGYGAIKSGYDKISTNYDETAKIFGKSNFFILKNIHFPLIKKAFAASLVLSFVDVIKELPLTLILRPFNFDTLSTRIYELADQELVQQAAVPALLVICVGIIPVLLFDYLGNKD